ncbi:lysylphosphatidylglycerol synthase transmembrane domain-containing protein [Paracoccus sp. Z330]|uniref:Lysylphosphatidylglycerol synthase transmembrane domain-containing protein n=1 Tax=Paracoccus onchidii TaxID=3017813 RepID=A0ABT4ZEK7_9RHOB|nr:lysylphosphatidylglycerol synthase transmembrane domain-containing protein [Paracoccus onchidii]MDB6177755.1 lysylphosphatidylglycerol synthase transmembrane domain-containing protein [Paracoccus onchidii]
MNVLRAVIALSMLALVWLALRGTDALTRLGDMSPGWALAAFVALNVQTWLSAWRWRLTARQLGIGISASHALGEYYLGQLVNQILPGGMTGDVGRALRSAGRNGRTPAALAVILERFMGNAMLVVVLLTAVVAVWVLPVDQPLPPHLPAILTVLLSAVALAALIVARASGRVAATLRQALSLGLMARGMLSRQILLSLGTVLANIAAFALAARATGTTLPPLTALILIPPILFAMMIPISIAGWGVREGAAAAIFPLAGLGAGAGLAASLAFGILFLVSSLPGLVVPILRRSGNARAHRRVCPTSPASDKPKTEIS